MTSDSALADRTIAALRQQHDQLAALVPGLDDTALAAPSGASEWSVAQVLSHLGSGAEIGHAGYRAALAGEDAPDGDFNQQVWDRWNAMAPGEQAAGYLEHDAALVALLEGLSAEQRSETQVTLGFLPAPLPIGSVAGMRLNEVAQHSWDVRVALDPDAEVDAEAASVVLEHFAGALGFLLGFTGKADQLAAPASVALAGTGRSLAITDTVTVVDGEGDATATFTGGAGAAVRLLGGRLTPARTPQGVEVTGAVTLDDLRRVFPGY